MILLKLPKLWAMALLMLSATFLAPTANAQYMPPPLSSTGFVNGMVFGEEWERENSKERARKQSNNYRAPYQKAPQ